MCLGRNSCWSVVLWLVLSAALCSARLTAQQAKVSAAGEAADRLASTVTAGAASDLAELGAAGEQAIGFLADGTSPSMEWTQQQTSLLDRAAKPKELLRVAVLNAVRKLVIAAGSH